MFHAQELTIWSTSDEYSFSAGPCLLCLVHLEPPDSEQEVNKLCGSIKKFLKNAPDVRAILLSPFSHLGHEVMPHVEAKEFYHRVMIPAIRCQLTISRPELRVEFSPFNTEKGLRLELSPKSAVAYRSS